MNAWTVVPLERALGAHAAEWNALNRSRFGNQVMLSSLFVDGLLREFGNGREHLCILRQDGEVRAMLIAQRRNRFVWSSFVPPQCQLALTMVPDAALLATLIASLPQTVIQFDLLCNDPQVGRVLDCPRPVARRQPHALTMNVSLAGTFAGYWAGRSRNLTSNMRRYERRIEQDGLAARLVRIDDPEQIGAALERYVQIEGAGWKGKLGTALGSTPEQHRFYQKLFAEGAREGVAMIYELWLGEHLAASRLLLGEGGTLVILKTTYDETMERYAPGRLLLRALIEDAFERWPGGTIEFYTDASSDQLQWASTSRWIEHLTLFRNPASNFAHQALKIAARTRPPRLRKGRDLVRDKQDDSEVTAYVHPDELPQDVRDFLQQAEARNLGFGFDWYRNLALTVYSADQTLRFYCLRRGGRVMAVLPLRLEASRFGWQAHALSNFYTTLYEPLLMPNTKGAQLLPLLERLRADFPGIGSLMLAPMAPGSHAYVVLLEALGLARWFPFEFFAFGNWYEPVRTTWSVYLAQRASNVRSTIARSGKKFAAEGGVLELVTRSEDLPEAIAAYEKVYAASWKKPEPYKQFMPGLLQACADKGMLRLGLARLNGEVIAAQAWIVGHGRAEIYKVAHDEAFKEYSPGTLITAMLMQHTIDVDKVKEIDYLIGDDPYKKTWMSERRERWGIVAYNLNSLPGIAGFAREAFGRLAKQCMQRWRQRRQPVAQPASCNTGS